MDPNAEPKGCHNGNRTCFDQIYEGFQIRTGVIEDTIENCLRLVIVLFAYENGDIKLLEMKHKMDAKLKVKHKSKTSTPQKQLF